MEHHESDHQLGTKTLMGWVFIHYLNYHDLLPAGLEAKLVRVTWETKLVRVTLEAKLVRVLHGPISYISFKTYRV